MKRIRAATGTPTSRNLIVRHAYVEERPCKRRAKCAACFYSCQLLWA